MTADDELDQASAMIVSYRLSRLIELDEERRGPDEQPRNQAEFARHLERRTKRYTKQHVNAVVNYWKRPGERNPRISFELVDEAGDFWNVPIEVFSRRYTWDDAEMGRRLDLNRALRNEHSLHVIRRRLDFIVRCLADKVREDGNRYSVASLVDYVSARMAGQYGEADIKNLLDGPPSADWLPSFELLEAVVEWANVPADWLDPAYPWSDNDIWERLELRELLRDGELRLFAARQGEDISRRGLIQGLRNIQDYRAHLKSTQFPSSSMATSHDDGGR